MNPETPDAPSAISVVIVNWNHGAYLPACLQTLRAQEPCPEITVVDNASTDGSADWVAQNDPAVHLLRLDTNQGFARAFNLGAAQSNSRWVASINPDLQPRAGFIRALLDAAEQDERIGICAPKLLRADHPELLDSTGLFINRWRRPYDRGQMRPDEGQYDRRVEIFGACGAAVLFRRAMLEDIAVNGEYFDEDFFAYYEDIDLAWRAHLRGWRAVYAPLAVAEHARGWGDTLRKGSGRAGAGPRLALRNRYLMSLKNDAVRYLLLDMPGTKLCEIPRLAYMLLFRPAALLGLVDIFRLLPAMLRKRRTIRARQTVPDRALRGWFTRDWNE